jgi:hypothetical protein
VKSYLLHTITGLVKDRPKSTVLCLNYYATGSDQSASATATASHFCRFLSCSFSKIKQVWGKMVIDEKKGWSIATINQKPITIFRLQIENDNKMQADILMDELTTLIEKPKIRNAEQKYQLWISEKSWILIDKKSKARKSGDLNI